VLPVKWMELAGECSRVSRERRCFFTGSPTNESFSRALCSASIQHSGNKVHGESQTYQSQGCDDTLKKKSGPSNAEYDEGTQVYMQTISLHDGIKIEIIPTVLSFNIAQTYHYRGETNEARKWMCEALHQLKFAGNTSSETALLLIKILNCLGYCYFKSGDGDSAAMLYQKSLTMTSRIELGSSDHIAAALNCMGVVIFNQQPESQKAIELFEKSLELYRKGPTASSQRYRVKIATVLNNIGRTKYLQSKFEESRSAYAEALELRKELLGNDSIDVATTYYNIGQTYQQLKDYTRAFNCFVEFLCIARASFGEESRDVALVYKAIAEIHQEQGELKLAHHFLSLSLRAQVAASSRSNLDVATTLNKLGNICYQMKDFESALKHYSEGLVIEHSNLPKGHPHIMITFTNIAHIHKQIGDHAKALAAYKHVHTLQVEAYGPDDMRLAETLFA